MIDSLLCKFSRNVLQKYRLRDKLDQVGCTRAFGPRWPSMGPVGPRVDSCGGHGFVSGILLQIKNYYVLYDNEKTGLRPLERSGLRPLWRSGLRPLWRSGLRPLERSGLRPLERSGLRPFAERSDATTKSISLEIHQKNGGNFWILRDRRKGFSERPKKVHFWKIHFQNLFQKSKF